MGPFFHHHDPASPVNLERGFTLVEMLVAFAIITVIAGVIFSGQNNFNKTIILANTTYDIALTLRSAETHGIGGHAMGMHPVGYGIHFDKMTPKSFVLFGDAYPALPVMSPCHTSFESDPAALDAQPGDCVYTPGQDSLVTTYTIGRNAAISKFCAFDGSWTCSTGALNSLDIVFARPNPTPLMSADGAYVPLSPVTHACITLASEGNERHILIEPSGKIEANASSCP